MKINSRLWVNPNVIFYHSVNHEERHVNPENPETILKELLNRPYELPHNYYIKNVDVDYLTVYLYYAFIKHMTMEEINT